MVLKLYKISQNINNDYDTYDSAVVCAKSKNDAKTIHPGKGSYKVGIDKLNNYDSWCLQKDVHVEYLGVAQSKVKRGVICSSFNAG
jgi:hypothetical protein